MPIVYMIGSRAFVSSPEIEQVVKEQMMKYSPDTLVTCQDYETGETIEILELGDLFNNNEI
jgi:hypothetical protein